ncbi:MAG: sterol desaturase family protein [Alphaproteobacteria bacterium]|nr:sterol desaturase family protein [Alphaproteobacteria bacterium]
MTINWGLLQFGVFLSMFATLVVAERIWPRRKQAVELVSRWSANMGFTVVNALTGTVLHLIIPVVAVAAALYAQDHGIGLFPETGTPWWIAAPLSLAALDLTLYAFHVACHKVPWLWSFHRVHHLDLEVDATTAFRSHPFEFLSSQILKLGVIYALGTPAVAVLAYEILLNIFAMFSHSNVRLSDAFDRNARWLVVTPDMHRIHHSTYQRETDSNYGVVTPLWDRLFGTYLAAPRDGQTGMTLGLNEVRGREAFNLFWLVACPFISFKSLGKHEDATQVPATTSLHTTA